ncbi:tetratricopeptide repeat protein [Confluentibacter citreus]|uniref:tetratricopeptide repeat protein n=1 Tax=Confluentibacter citreus TaxID=2007307 RepID=UPI0012FD1360|nr:tetratricopeptide repeat protein [Confluentibacter citreus]
MEWYRKKSWTENDKEHFFTKLKRARKDNRAEYLRIQAVELIETDNPKLLEVAESLLTQMLTEYPDENFSISSALNSLGDIYYKQNKLEKAIDFYKKSVDFEKKYPNLKTQSYLGYSELIIKTNKIDQFDFVKRIILERFNNIFFPVEKYKTASILSIIYQRENQTDLAEKYANIAEHNANKETSGLRYHKNLGIVSNRKSWLDKLVNRK